MGKGIGGLMSVAVFVVLLVVAGGVLYGLQSGFFDRKLVREQVVPVLPRIVYSVSVLNDTGGKIPATLYAYTDGVLKHVVMASVDAPNVFVLDQNHTYWWVASLDGYYGNRAGLFASFGVASENKTCRFEGVDFYCSEETIVLHKVATDLNLTFVPKFSKGVSNYTLFYESRNELRRPMLCWKWNFGVVRVSVQDSQRASAPKRLDKQFFDVCYQVKGVYVERRNVTVSVDFTESSQNVNPEIELWVIDQNVVFNQQSPEWGLSGEDEFGRDNGLLDVKVRLSFQNASFVN